MSHCRWYLLVLLTRSQWPEVWSGPAKTFLKMSFSRKPGRLLNSKFDLKVFRPLNEKGKIKSDQGKQKRRGGKKDKMEGFVCTSLPCPHWSCRVMLAASCLSGFDSSMKFGSVPTVSWQSLCPRGLVAFLIPCVPSHLHSPASALWGHSLLVLPSLLVQLT